MALLRMPVDSENPNYNFNTSLEGREYNFEFIWNGRSQLWYMSILNPSRETLIMGSIPLVLGVDLTGQYIDPDLPPGDFYAINLTGANAPPDRYNFGSDVILYYLESIP